MHVIHNGLLSLSQIMKIEQVEKLVVHKKFNER